MVLAAAVIRQDDAQFGNELTIAAGNAAGLVASAYTPLLLLVGCLILFIAWAPLALRRLPLSVPILCVSIGWLLFSMTPLSVYSPHPSGSPILIERAAELIVIVSLMGAGLKIDRALTIANWSLTIRLLAITMPLTILLLMALGVGLLGLPLAAALLLAAALAPTDPVLASDVQIESPEGREENEARFALTSEAGLNDALAFPFIHLAVAASLGGFTLATWQEWAVDAVLIRLSVGFVVGVTGGWLLGYVTYRLPKGTRLSRSGDGFVALGATLAIYAVAEFAHGYGFLAVFIAGLMLRRAAQGNDFNTRLHDFADEAERLLMLLLLVLFGAMLAGGALLETLRWSDITFALIALALVRPVAGLIGLAGTRQGMLERGIIATFGIRGLGSVYYLAYGINHGQFDDADRLWSVLSLVVLLSIVAHGITVTPLMRRLERYPP
ncbi:MAG: cation:proton antiporter [Sphingopyxis sp.]|nr:cation:proton antiporter [Sphingopyxis sp.]